VRMLRVALETALSQAKVVLLTDVGNRSVSSELPEYRGIQVDSESSGETERPGDDDLPF